MADAFDAAWDIIKMGKEEDDEERRMLQHIASMVMGMNDEEADSYGSGYIPAMMSAGRDLDDFIRRRQGESGGYMREFDDMDDPRPSDVYEAPTMVRGDMAKLMALIQSNPEMYFDTGYDGNMAGHYGGYSMKRPDMTGFYQPMDEDESPLGDDYTGEYFGDDGNIRGELSKIRLLDALKRMGLL